MPVLPPQAIQRDMAPRGASEAPPPSMLESMGAAWRLGTDDVGFVQDERRKRAYGPVISALKDLYPKADYFNIAPWKDAFDYDAIWRDVARARAANPQAFADLPADRATFERDVATRRGERDRDRATASRSENTVADFGAMVASQILDPVNVATMPIGGGGRTLGKVILTEAIANAAIEAVQQVPLAATREAMGETLTAGEIATNIAAGAVFGGAIGGAGHAIGRNFDRIKAMPKAAQEAAWARIVPHLPEAMRPAMDWDAVGAMPDDALADLAESLIGADNLSVRERDAISVQRSAAAIERANPFQANGAGMAMHQEQLAAAINRVLDGAASRPSPPAILPTRASAVRPRLDSSTAITTGTVAGTGRDILKRQIGRVESAGGKQWANPRSSARGLYQFIDSTWMTLYRARFGGDLSPEAMLAKRADPRVQEILMDDLISANERVLRSAGISPSAGNLYLAHFAGSGGATKLHAADPRAPVEAVLGRQAVAANPFLKGMSAGDVIAWAHRKMGQAVPQGGAVTVRPDIGEEDFRFRLQEEIDRAENERLAIEAQLRADDVAPEAVVRAMDAEPEPMPLDDIADAAAPVPREPDIAAQEAMVRPRILEMIRDPARPSLKDSAALADQLQVTETAVRRVLNELAARGHLRMDRNGRVSRRPVETGPVDVLKFVARGGGITDREGHALHRIFETVRTQKVVDDRYSHREPEFNPKTGKFERRKIVTKVRIGNRFIPGAGNLLRENGRTVDEWGEILWEAGYFPPWADRPTESDVIELLTRAHGGERIVPFEDMDFAALDPQAVADPDRPPKSEHVMIVDAILDTWEDFPQDGEIEAIRRIAAEIADRAPEGPALYRAAALEYVNREADNARWDALEESGDDVYDAEWDEHAFDPGPEDRAGEAGGGGRTPDAGDPQAQPADRAVDGTGPPAPIDPERFAPFDDPQGPATMAQAASMEHDLTTALEAADVSRETGPAPDQADFAAPTQDQARTALEQQGEGRMKGRVAQKPPGSDGGLFDTMAGRDMEFRFDEDGPAMNAADLLADIDADAAVAKTIRDCL